LHGEADDGAALLLQEGGDGGRVDTAGHGDGNKAALCFGALRQSVELGCGNHSYFIISGNLSIYLRGGARGVACCAPTKFGQPLGERQEWAVASLR